MTYLGDTTATIELGEKKLIDEHDDYVQTFHHILTTLELELKCAPVGMTIHLINGGSIYYRSQVEMLQAASRWDWNQTWGVNNIREIHLHYFTYTEIHTPLEYRQDHLKGYIPVGWNDNHENDYIYR